MAASDTDTHQDDTAPDTIVREWEGWEYTLTPTDHPCPECGHSHDAYAARTIFCCRGCGLSWSGHR